MIDASLAGAGNFGRTLPSGLFSSLIFDGSFAIPNGADV
jgi:hypothetical protein